MSFKDFAELSFFLVPPGITFCALSFFVWIHVKKSDHSVARKTWWLMSADYWLIIDHWWLMINNWWLMTDDWWLMIDDWYNMKWTPYCLPQGGTPPGVIYILHFILYLYLFYHQSSIITHHSSIISHQSSVINHQLSIINHPWSMINHQSSITSHRFCYEKKRTSALLSWHALFSRHSVITFFSTLGDQFLTYNVGATGWEPSDIIEDPRGSLETIGNSW